jgi:hypothetical protein
MPIAPCASRCAVPMAVTIGLVLCALCIPASALATRGEPPSGSLPSECTLEPGDPGHYIVVLYDWVEDPRVIALKQVERYEGTLGFVYESALKGYSAQFLPESARALLSEPTVKSVNVDYLTWMDDSLGFVQWYSCPLALPVGPKPAPEQGPAAAESPEAPRSLEDVTPFAGPSPNDAASGTSVKLAVKRCPGRTATMRKGRHCPSKAGRHRSACGRGKTSGRHCPRGV